MSILIIAIGFIATGIFIGLFATSTAPLGYQDESGFHYGNEHGHAAPRREPTRRRHVGTATLSPKPA